MPGLQSLNFQFSLISNLNSEYCQDVKNEYASLLPQSFILDVELDVGFGAVKANRFPQICICIRLHTPEYLCYLESTVDQSCICSNCKKVIQSFSGLQRLKTYPRSNTSKTLLSDLPLLHIHHDKKLILQKLSMSLKLVVAKELLFLDTPHIV